MHRPPALRRTLALIAVVALGATFLGACGDDDDAKTTDTEQESTPEDVMAPMDEVLAGLPTLKDHAAAAAAAAAAGDYDGALEEYEELHEVWESIEGTIKTTDVEIYERIETAQALIKDGAENDDAERVQLGVDNQAAAVDEFATANG